MDNLTKTEIRKKEKIDLLIEFKKLYGREPKSKETYKGENLGTFLQSIRQGHCTISPDDIKILESQNIRIQKRNFQLETHEKVLLLIEFIKLYNREPKVKETYKGVKIGLLLNNIRYSNTLISKADEKELKNLGISLETPNIQKRTHKKVLYLVEFIKLNYRAPKVTECYKGIKIGQFLQSIKKSRIYISEEDKALLDENSINFDEDKV